MPNEKFLYQYGTLNPVTPDEDTYTHDNPKLETPLDRLHKVIKPKSEPQRERTFFVGHVVSVLKNIGIEDLSHSQRSAIAGNPKKSKLFAVRIPEAFSAVIPEAINIGGKKKKVDDLYVQLEKEVTFIIKDPDLPTPAIGDLVRCDFFDRKNPSQGGIIHEIIGKQGNRSGGYVAVPKDDEAKDSFEKEGAESTPVEEPNPNSPPVQLGADENHLYKISSNYTSLPQKSGGFPNKYKTDNFIEAMLLDSKIDTKSTMPLDILSSEGPYSAHVASQKRNYPASLSYYINYGGISSMDNDEFINSHLSTGIVYGLSLYGAANSIPLSAELKRGDIVNIWKKTESGWVSSSALIDSKNEDFPGEYILIGSCYWQTLLESDKRKIKKYSARLENTIDKSISACRLHSSFNTYLRALN